MIKKGIALLLNFTLIFNVQSQSVEYKSNFKIQPSQLDEFYSTIEITSQSILFNCNNYKLYSIDKNNYSAQWVTRLGRKSNSGLFAHDTLIWASKTMEFGPQTFQFSSQTGEIMDSIPLANLHSKPFIQKGIIYTTGLSDLGGVIMAYDFQNKSIIWQKFIAHGIDKNPIYTNNYIWVNAEGDQWFKINYQGQLMDSTCKNKNLNTSQEIPCLKKLLIPSHDNKILTDTKIKKIDPEFNQNEFIYAYGPNSTVLLYENTMLLFKNNKFKKINLNEHFKTLNGEYNPRKSILNVAKDEICIYLNNTIIYYSQSTNKIIKTIDLNQWKPHQVILDHENIWLISSIDGQLYKIKPAS